MLQRQDSYSVKEECAQGKLTHRFLPCIVDCKLCIDEKLVPVSHGRGHTVSEHVLNCVVCPFSLTIGLRVKGCGHVPCDAHSISSGTSVVASKLRASIRDDFQWTAMIAEHMLHEQFSPGLCSALCCTSG